MVPDHSLVGRNAGGTHGQHARDGAADGRGRRLNTRLIQLDEIKHGHAIQRLEPVMHAISRRVDDLEGARDQQREAKGLVDCIRQAPSWLLALLIAIIARPGVKTGVKP